MPIHLKRTPRSLMLTLLVAGLGCATEKAPPTAAAELGLDPSAEPAALVHAEGNAEAQAEGKVTVSPSLGGQMLLVGDYQMELSISEAGAVKALLFDAQGKAVDPSLVTDLQVALTATGDLKPQVTLLWDAAAKCFAGQAAGGAKLVASKPVNVSFDVQGEPQLGVLTAYTLVPSPELDAQVGAAASAKVAVPSPNVKAKLTGGGKAIGDAKTALNAGATAAAKAQASSKAALNVSAPKPALKVDVKKSAPASTQTGTGASVKAKASFGFGK